MGTLYIVATPIGNLEDLSPRALRILQQARLVAAEDTRQTGVLLAHYQVRTPQTSYHEHNKIKKIRTILDALEEGDVALVSDAGTPVLNDPGYELVQAALEAGHRVSPIPGPSAPVAALVASGLPADSFLYMGYLPRRSKDRLSTLTGIARQVHTLIFLETPHRLLAALADLLEAFGDRQIAVARELTKLHEEIFRGTISEAQARFSETPPRGEITLVVAGAERVASLWSEERLVAALQEAQKAGAPPGEIARQLAGLSGWRRKDVYRILLALRK
jgi:16S rRNA (cytidine1402-2'-O)-methyltransferase